MDKYILFQYVEDNYDNLASSKILGPVNNDNLEENVNELIEYLDFAISKLHDYNQVVEQIIIKIKNSINVKNISRYINDDGIYSLNFYDYSNTDACINFIPVNCLSKIEMFTTGIGPADEDVSIIHGIFATEADKEEKEKLVVFMYYEYKINNIVYTRFKIIGIYSEYSDEIKHTILKDLSTKTFMDEATFNKIKADNMEALFEPNDEAGHLARFITYKKPDILDPYGFFMVLRAIPLDKISTIDYKFNSKGDLS